jgi:hypothetical protein
MKVLSKLARKPAGVARRFADVVMTKDFQTFVGLLNKCLCSVPFDFALVKDKGKSTFFYFKKQQFINVERLYFIQ